MTSENVLNLKKRHFLILRACEMGEDQTPIENAVEETLLDIDFYGRSQVPLDDKYIVDFVTRDGKMAIECDGAQYHQRKNTQRDNWILCNYGLRILHLSGRTCLDPRKCRFEIEKFHEDKDISIRYA